MFTFGEVVRHLGLFELCAAGAILQTRQAMVMAELVATVMARGKGLYGMFLLVGALQ